ncbi:Hypothetical predicted protein, partial [Paramuricea clavata]
CKHFPMKGMCRKPRPTGQPSGRSRPSGRPSGGPHPSGRPHPTDDPVDLTQVELPHQPMCNQPLSSMNLAKKKDPILVVVIDKKV